MQKRYWIGFGLVLVILLGAFCAPWLLLRWEQQRAEKQVLTVTEDAQLRVSQLSLSEKHRFLSNETFIILQESELSEEEGQRLKDGALQELDLLWRSGAVDDLSYSAAIECGSDLQVRLCVAITDAAVSRFYILRDTAGILQLYLDVDTEKILRLSLLGAWEQEEEMLRLWEADKSTAPPEAWEQMEAWAQYYGLKLEDVRLRLEEDGLFCQEAILTDEDGQRVVFCKAFNSENGGLGWRSVPERDMDIGESPIQFGGEEDTNIR